MAISLAYLDDLSRVQITLSGIEDGTVRIERSTNQLFWQTVRGGVELPVSGGTASLFDYEFTPDVENFYRVIRLDPTAGLVLPGTSGSYASTPDTGALDITSDIDIRIDLTADNWGTEQTLAAKFVGTGNQRSWRVGLIGGQILFDWSPTGAGGVPSETSTAFSTPATEERQALRVTLDADFSGQYVVGFWVADTINDPFSLIQTRTGATGPTSIFNSTAPLEVGSLNNGTGILLTGTVHALEVRNGINGTVAADPHFTAQSDGTTNFVDDAGRAWTVHGNAEIVAEVTEQDSITPNLMGQYWLKVPELPFLNREINCVIASNVERPSRTGIFDIKGRSLPVAVSDLKGSQQFSIAITTQTLEEARDMDLILATGKTILIHVPQEDVSGCGPVKAVPGGYVQVGTTTQRRAVPGSRIYQFTLPCVVVAPPGPDVIPTTLIWGTVFNMFGDWNALIAANPTWNDLLATVGSPEDPVVL